MTITPRPTPSPWAGLARDCLTAAMRQDMAAVQAAASALVAEHGADVLPDVILAWIDTALQAQGITPGQGEGEPAMLMFGDVDTGRVATDADDVDPEIAWAGRLMNARVADDQGSYEALMRAVPPGQDSRYINVLLSCCAQTCRLGAAIRRSR